MAADKSGDACNQNLHGTSLAVAATWPLTLLLSHRNDLVLTAAPISLSCRRVSSHPVRRDAKPFPPPIFAISAGSTGELPPVQVQKTVSASIEI